MTMEAVSTSETSVYNETTRLYIPEDSKLQNSTRLLHLGIALII
jgi:hypothetical protein